MIGWMLVLVNMEQSENLGAEGLGLDLWCVYNIARRAALQPTIRCMHDIEGLHCIVRNWYPMITTI
jgi:hypothetical protein